MKPARTVAVAVMLSVLPAVAAAPASQLPSDFEWIWNTIRSQLFDSTLVDRFFTEGNRSALAERARTARSEGELAVAVNSLLDSLHLSHLRLFTESDLEYYLFQSMIVTRDPAKPPIYLVGMQCTPAESTHVVRAVWDGYPAEHAGLQRGDIILTADGERFQPVNSFRAGRVVDLAVLRQGAILHVHVDPVDAGVDASLLQAMKNSVRHLTLDGHRVGYVHLWSGTCPEIQSEFTRIITEELHDAEGIVLDLRDGWGGAWYDYLDPFFEDRSDFYVATVIRRGENIVARPTPVGPHAWFRGPLVVLIDEGTRSGKEALAFQFKKSKRAVLVGTTTAGAFTGGANYFRGGFVLYLPFNGPILLDGQDVEGVGVAPDVRVDDPVERPSPGDPQLERGLEELRRQLSDR